MSWEGSSPGHLFAAFACPHGRNQPCFEAFARKAGPRAGFLLPLHGEGGAEVKQGCSPSSPWRRWQAQELNVPDAFPATCYPLGRLPSLHGGDSTAEQQLNHPRALSKRRGHPKKKDLQTAAPRGQAGEELDGQTASAPRLAAQDCLQVAFKPLKHLCYRQGVQQGVLSVWTTSHGQSRSWGKFGFLLRLLPFSLPLQPPPPCFLPICQFQVQQGGKRHWSEIPPGHSLTEPWEWPSLL